MLKRQRATFCANARASERARQRDYSLSARGGTPRARRLAAAVVAAAAAAAAAVAIGKQTHHGHHHAAATGVAATTTKAVPTRVFRRAALAPLENVRSNADCMRFFTGLFVVQSLLRSGGCGRLKSQPISFYRESMF